MVWRVSGGLRLVLFFFGPIAFAKILAEPSIKLFARGDESVGEDGAVTTGTDTGSTNNISSCSWLRLTLSSTTIERKQSKKRQIFAHFNKDTPILHVICCRITDSQVVVLVPHSFLYLILQISPQLDSI